MEQRVYLYNGLEYDADKIKASVMASGVLDVVRADDTVAIKPNFVQEHRERDEEWDFVITHPACITAVIAALAPILAGKGKIILIDGPMTASSFDAILAHMPVSEWERICAAHEVRFEIVDLRDEEWLQSKNHVTLKRRELPGDPAGKEMFDLRDDASEFYGKDNHGNALYGADYDIERTNAAHNGSNNRYSVSASIIAADVFINMPKLKSHKKAGITCCLKNLVGINTDKNLLPHHTLGTPLNGGDEFAAETKKASTESVLANRAKKLAYRFGFLAPLLVPLKKAAVLVCGDNQKTIRNGAWYGNDTLWRTILDLNKILLYGKPGGTLKDDRLSSRKKYIAIVDAIYGGEGNGPLDPEKVDCGCLIVGENPVAVDAVCARLMRFDYQKLPHLKNAFGIKKYPLFDGTYEDIRCSVDGGAPEKLAEIAWQKYPVWRAAPGWAGHVEEQTVTTP